MQSFFEAADRGAEIAKLDIYFCLFNVYLWNRLVVKEDLVEFYKRLLQVVILQSLLCLSETFQDFLFSDPRKLIFLHI